MKKLFVPLITILILTLTACSSDKSSYETIPLTDVTKKAEQGYIVLDVREENEFAEGHIPNAVNKPLSKLQQDDFEQLSKEEKYVVICRSGNRSQTASDILSAEGYEVINVSEGMSSWTGEIE